MNLLQQLKAVPHGVKAIKEWLGEGGTVVGLNEAQTRADICLNCPKQVPRGTTVPVGVAIKRLLEIKNGLQLRVKGEKQLGLCGICQCVLRLQIWQPDDMITESLTHEERNQLPKHCWKLKPTQP